LLPPLSAEEFAGLEASILKDGCLSPLVIWNNILVDGHHRYEICRKHQIPYSVNSVVLDSIDDAKLWAWQHQENRRNLTAFQRVEIALKLKVPSCFINTDSRNGIRVDLLNDTIILIFGDFTMAQLNFDASQVDPSVPFEAIPSDKYFVEISGSQVKATKAGDGSYLELEYTVLEGDYRGRKVWDRLCLNHSSQKTVEIARANLSAVCHAVGILKPRDSNELHHIPLVITVKLKKDDTTDNIYNEVKGYAKRESLVAQTPPPSPADQVQMAQYPQTPVNHSTPPWSR